MSQRPRALKVLPGPAKEPRKPDPETRVLLINPWQSYPPWLGNEFQSYLPLGVAMLAAVVERAGVQVKIVDCLAHHIVQLAGGKVRFGLQPQQLARQIAEFAPHVVGITNPFSSFIDDALAAAKLVKSVDPAIKVVLGGVEPSLVGRNDALLRNNTSLDVLVKGEGEVTFSTLIAHFDPALRGFVDLDQVGGILFRDGDAVRENESRAFLGSLDDLPLPAYHLLDLDQMFANPFYARYRGGVAGVRSLPIHTSRGCPYSCSFCSVHSQVGKAHRRHSTAYVVDHIRHVMDRYGVEHFHFEDDNLTLNPHHARALFTAIQPLGISWDTPNGVRADTIDPELAALMKASGARSVTIAVESGDQRVLDTIVNKRLDLEDVVKGVSSLRGADIPTVVFFIVGFPGEREQDVRQTIRFGKRLALEHDTLNLLFVATPLPGTPLDRECEANGYFLREQNNESLLSAIRLNQTSLIATPEFTKGRLFEWAKQELDVPELHTVSRHIPMFFSRSQTAVQNFARFLGGELKGPLRNYWREPHNNPPPVMGEEAPLRAASSAATSLAGGAAG
jgi:anaerobic magnesium-protoporphyrin IX monomethyl ester cyclase